MSDETGGIARIRAEMDMPVRGLTPFEAALRHDVRTLLAALDERTAERDAAVARAEAAERRLVFSEEWHGPRWERLRDLLRGTEYERRACEIMANGTPSRDASGAVVYEPPTYAQQLQRAKWRAEAAEGWRERWEVLAATLSAEVGPWEGCGVDVAVQRVRDEARRAAIEEASRLYHRTRASCYDDEEHDATYLDGLSALLDAKLAGPG